MRKLIRLIYRIFREWNNPKPKMKLLAFLFLPFLAFSQTKIYVDPATNIKMAITEYNDVPIIKIKPGQNTKFILKKDVNFAPNAILVDVPRDSTVHYEVRMEVIIVPETTQPPVIIAEQIIDAEQATFTGVWTKGPTNATGWYANTIAYSNAPGATVSYTFTGRKVELYGETLPGHGSGTIKIDNEAEVPVSFKSATKVLPAKIFEKSWATDGQHTIVLKVVSGYNLVDYFKVYKAQ